ncbi:hypothetical protein FRZ67_16970 [Panacibacter ginsenosidivorans]|uniref:Uncharacterized protein n=1 Tax=Panacibacter ginsenosidivorans TaxID=1813871 RepID=A0A5B8VF19_9BACT|nr:hypothetical protein [Panacibacter ginsenosidivorans]QEC68918.1 hypothetical protein FRZ67_16970 [Panacibacter ginsenosidivorans]
MKIIFTGDILWLCFMKSILLLPAAVYIASPVASHTCTLGKKKRQGNEATGKEATGKEATGKEIYDCSLFTVHSSFTFMSTSVRRKKSRPWF